MGEIESETHPGNVAFFDEQAYLALETCMWAEVSEFGRDGGVGFAEKDHLFGHLVPELLDVFDIVAPHAYDFRWCDRMIFENDTMHRHSSF